MNENVLSPDTRSVVQHNELLEQLNQPGGEPYKDTIQQSDSYPPERGINLEIEDTQEDNITKTGYHFKQMKAIFLKNVSLQKKQIGTNICQVITPIVCLLFTLLLKTIAENNLGNIFSYELSIPWMYNVPYDKVYGNLNPFFNGSSPLNFTSCLQWYLYDFENPSEETLSFVGNDQKGMLSNKFPPIEKFQDFYYCGDRKMPFFLPPVNGSINNQTFWNLKFLDTVDLTPLGEVPMLELIPDGSVTFYEASPKNLTFRLQMNDLRVIEYHRSNGVSRYRVSTNPKWNQDVLNVYEGYLILLDMMTKSYIQTLHDNVMVMSGSQVMPQTTSGRTFVAMIINVCASALYPIAISLLMPVYLQMIVQEKEERLREIMKMNGLKMRNYWFVNYIWFLTLYIAAFVIFILFGRYVLVTDFFISTDNWVLLVSFLGWGFCQVSLSFFYQNFISNAKTAMIFGYILTLWSALASTTFSSSVFPVPKKLPILMRLYPPFAFGRLVYYLTFKCNDFTCTQSFDQFNDEMWSCVLILYVGAVFVLLVLGLYLDVILPQQYGIRKHPFFFLEKLFPNKNVIKNYNFQTKFDDDDQNKEDIIEDEEVQKEKEFVQNMQPPFTEYPLVIKSLRKVYNAIGGKPPKIAVRNFSLHIKKGEMFGLLGPNGAGKTSLISMLTGLYPPENGNAWIGDYDIRTQIDLVHTQMGVCPQFDLQWPDLTVEDHLYFYARIRGVSSKNEKALVEKALKAVYLTKFATFQSKRLSGGMRRRLSVAIALVGDPKIIFLDEPTTGLDPENRRQLWDILVEAKGNRAIILTTHSMEEADVLCSRIGIITDGSLRCLGQQTALKSKYGGGYHLFINCHKHRYFTQSQSSNIGQPQIADECWKRLQGYISNLLPKAVLKSSFNGNFVYLIPMEGFEVSKLFGELEPKRDELAISDWGISQSTLEDVFMEIVESSEDAEK